MEKNLPPDRARDNQQKKDDHFTRAHDTNALPPDQSHIRDDVTWTSEQQNIAHLLKRLDNDVITADLHTHLLGMGDHSFWIDQIMRNYLFTMKDRTLESLEWYGPLCYRQLPNLEIVLKNTERGSYSINYDNQEVKMKLRNDGYHFTLHPTSDPFAFDVVRTRGHKKTTKSFKISNWGLSNRVSCEWNARASYGLVYVDAKSKAKQDWLNIGLPQNAWRVNTILNWRALKPVPFTDELLVNILRLHRESSWMNLPLSKSLCKQLMSMEVFLNASTWDWKAALNFTTDVVFDIESFQDSMHIAREFGEANVLHEMITRLALNRKGDSDRYLKKYMFFNAKAQQFDYQWGITNTDLCYLMEARSGTELEAKATLAQIRNCFTMLNIDGSAPSNSDLVHRFRRHFTPEFYPMRFKLRDPIYEQHPYTLTLLLKNVLQIYSRSRTSYVEFSLGLNSLITPWIYKYLVHESIWEAIPSPEVNAERPRMQYRFLIAFSRNSVKLPIDGELRTPTDSEEAWNFLVKSPNIAMAHSFNPEAYSAYDPFFKQLETILSCLKTTQTQQDKERGLLNAVVGLDLVSDELGYPYCPFIQDKWLDLASKFKLGIRLHCGEGVVRETRGPIKRAMYAHMYIMALAIRRICARGIKCRIGHGVAFQDCIVEELTEKKKSYERVPSSRSYCIPDGTRSLTPFLALISDLLVEVNITSNSYLVQHANSSFLIKRLDHWLLCTDDDGVWAPPPCAHDHRLQALEYCRAISMGSIDENDLLKAEHWREFCFNHSQPEQKEILQLEDTWTCKFHPIRAYATIAMALCTQPEIWNDSILSLGVTELLHSFGFYDGFATFATTQAIASVAEHLTDTTFWHSVDRRIQYFLRVLNPDRSDYGILRSLFLGFDECLQLIWYERDVKALCEIDCPVPPLSPKYPSDSQTRREEAEKLLVLSEAAAKQIVTWITRVRNLAESRNDLDLIRWMNSRLSLLDERGRSEMKYGTKYCQSTQSVLHESPYDESVFDKWQKGANNGVWKTFVEKSEKIKELEGLILCKSKFLQLSIDTDQQDKHNFFHIICNTQDQSWYIRPLQPSYVGEYIHVDAPDLEGFHTTITTDDRVPLVWYRAALSIATRLFPPTLQKSKSLGDNEDESGPQIIRIAGVGYSGSAIAVLAGLMIATEFRHQEAVKKTSVSNEVVVWTYGGKQFGSKSFHNKVHNLTDYNLEITQWRSLQDVEARTGATDSLFSLPYCYLKDILVYPIGPPMIIPWDLRPSWHYFALMLHHLPPCMEFRSEITKPNEMNIFFADNKKDLKSLAQSLYFPECTLICTHEDQHDENTNYGPLTEKKPNVKIIPMDKIRISPYVWKYHPQQRKNWSDIFNFTPVQTTMRLLGDLLLAILNLDDDIIISLSPNQCDIVTFATMSPTDVQNLNDAMARYVRKSEQKKLPYFMNLMNRRDTFNEEYCLLLLDLTYLRRSSDNNSRTSNIRRQLEKAFSTTIKPFRHPESDLITNVEILLITLQNSNVCNPFLRFILGQLDIMIDDLPQASRSHKPKYHLDIGKFKSDVTQLLRRGSPNDYDAWKLKTEIDDAMDYYTKYKKKFDKADVGSYKSFDLALSLYFLSGEDKTQVHEVMLRQVWNVTNWLTRRNSQQDIAKVQELWEYKISQVQATLNFLQTENMSEECKYIYDVEHQKVEILKKEIKNANEGWKSLQETLRSWGSMETRKNHVLFGDALFRYFKAVNQDPNDDLLHLCSRDLINHLSNIKNDPIALWVKGLLLYELGLIEKDPNNFVEAANVFSTLWKTGIQPKDRFSIALNAACCSARVGDKGYIAQAVSWIGNFFEVLEIADDMDRKVAFAWLENELESETGDLNNALLKQVIKPLFDDTKSRFGGESALAENSGDKTQGNDEMEVEKPQSSQGENRSDIQESA